MKKNNTRSAAAFIMIMNGIGKNSAGKMKDKRLKRLANKKNSWKAEY